VEYRTEVLNHFSEIISINENNWSTRLSVLLPNTLGHVVVKCKHHNFLRKVHKWDYLEVAIATGSPVYQLPKFNVIIGLDPG
jgi:hypothetical protein